MDLSGITPKAMEVITACGYGRERFMSGEEFIREPFEFYEEEGYRVSDTAADIINDFYMIQVGKLSKYEDEKLVITDNEFLENKFVVYPENIYEAGELFDKLGKAVGDYIIPLGVINSDYLAIGESGKIYIISDEVYIGGESWVDFLNNFAENFVFREETILQ